MNMIYISFFQFLKTKCLTETHYNSQSYWLYSTPRHFLICVSESQWTLCRFHYYKLVMFYIQYVYI